jgi:ATP-dependent DNA helicase RecQ
MNVCLIAVDEAHCISQWGYDFRPPYLEIAEIRKDKPDVPVIALTASATPHVVEDIMNRLEFRQRNLISASFFRENLAYHVEYSEDKDNRIIRMLQKNSDSCIVYGNTRQQVKQLAYKILSSGISCTYYHAGLTHEERDAAYRSWLHGTNRVICATNAFGMGIDKPDVRMVLHAGVPQSMEAYFQEAGRAGRDGKKSHAVVLYHHGDIEDLSQRVEQRYPEPDTIRKVYRSIASHIQLAMGAGLGETYAIDLTEISRKYDIPYATCVFSLQILALAGLVEFEEKSWQPSKVMLLVNKNDLYSFQVANPRWDTFIRTLLRSYGGLFEQYIQIREGDLARNLNTSSTGVKDALLKLKELGVVDYTPHTDEPKLTFLTGRLREEEIRLASEIYSERKKHEKDRAEAMKHYLQADVCRSVLLLSYFGEKENRPCGMCDVCRNPKTEHGSSLLHENAWEQIQRLLQESPRYPDEIPDFISDIPSETLREVIRWHLDKGNLVLDHELRLCTKAQLS